MNIPGRHNRPRVAILGAGAVGGFLAALFWKSGYPVTCLSSESGRSNIREQGIRLESGALGDVTAWPEVEERLSCEPEYLFVTTKAPFIKKALKQIPRDRINHSVVIPLLNGFEHVSLLRETLGRCVAVGMISVEVKRVAPCHVMHTSAHAKVELASDEDITPEQVKKAASALNGVGIHTQIQKSEADVIWRKLSRLNAIAATTAAAQRPVGYIRSNRDWRIRLERCLREGVSVAACEGVPIDADKEMQFIDGLKETLSTSLQRDVALGGTHELESIVGAVIRRAQRHGVPCPETIRLEKEIRNQVIVAKHRPEDRSGSSEYRIR